MKAEANGFRAFMKIDIVTDTFLPDVNGVAMTLGRLTELPGDQNDAFTPPCQIANTAGAVLTGT